MNTADELFLLSMVNAILYLFIGIYWGLVFKRKRYENKIEDLEAVITSQDHQLGEISRLLHYPGCWDTAVYSTLYDAIFEFWDGCQVCKDPDSFIGEVDD